MLKLEDDCQSILITPEALVQKSFLQSDLKVHVHIHSVFVSRRAYLLFMANHTFVDHGNSSTLAIHTCAKPPSFDALRVIQNDTFCTCCIMMFLQGACKVQGIRLPLLV